MPDRERTFEVIIRGRYERVVEVKAATKKEARSKALDVPSADVNHFPNDPAHYDCEEVEE